MWSGTIRTPDDPVLDHEVPQNLMATMLDELAHAIHRLRELPDYHHVGFCPTGQHELGFSSEEAAVAAYRDAVDATFTGCT